MARTLWLFREKLAEARLIEKLFDRFDQQSISPALKMHRPSRADRAEATHRLVRFSSPGSATREEHEAIKRGRPPRIGQYDAGTQEPAAG